MKANLLKAEMIKQNVTLSDLSEWLKIQKSSIYRRISGRTAFTADEIKVIKKKLNLNDAQTIQIFID